MFFLRGHAPLLEEKHPLKEIPRAQRLLHRPSLKQLVPRVVRDDTVLRDTTNRQAYVDYGYSMAAIATHADVQYSTVSKIVKGEREHAVGRICPPCHPFVRRQEHLSVDYVLQRKTT